MGIDTLVLVHKVARRQTDGAVVFLDLKNSSNESRGSPSARELRGG